MTRENFYLSAFLFILKLYQSQYFSLIQLVGCFQEFGHCPEVASVVLF